MKVEISGASKRLATLRARRPRKPETTRTIDLYRQLIYALISFDLIVIIYIRDREGLKK